jgi:hypothetical protein
LSFSRCLNELEPAHVLHAVDAALASRSMSAACARPSGACGDDRR